MNICLLNNIFPPINTGSSFYTLDLATHLHNKGHKIIVITSKTDTNKRDYELHSYGFKVYRIKKLIMPKFTLWMKFPDFYITLFPSNFRKVKQILIDNDIELLHQCNNIFDLVFISAFFSKKLKIPLVCSLTTQIQHANPFFNKVLELFDKIIIKYFFSNYVNTYIALDKETLRYINERYCRYSGITIIPFGIPKLNQFSLIKRDYNKTTCTLISLGHVSDIKDRREIISAWLTVKQKIGNAKIKIIGELFSRKAAKLVNKLKLGNDIVFAGRIKHSDIPQHILNADIGSILFSNIPYHRGVGTANLELMASGLPVILDADDDFFGPKFPFKNDVHFIKLENRDPKWLSNKITELFRNPEMRKRIGKAGKEFATTQLTWENIIPMIENVYAEAINNKNE